MAEVVENTNTTDISPRRTGLISTIFRSYRKNFALFWRIMVPIIIFSVLFDIGANFSDSFFGPENLWHFDTARGMSVGKYPESTGVGSGMIFRFHVFSLGFLWLTMCPLIFAMVERRRDVEVAARGAWRRARGKVVPILAASFLLYLLGIGAFLSFSLFASGIVPDVPLPFGSSLYLGLFLIIGGIIYLGVNWSLYNQIIIIEDQQSTIASLRRSSELVRGVWGRTFGMYLLLALATMMFTSTILGLTLLLFSLTVPEFAPLREVLLSVKFLTLFVGGYARISFENAPSFWTVGVMVLVNTLIHAFLAPVWAILTTHLYMERAAISNQQSEE
jgi:hypothetical protein